MSGRFTVREFKLPVAFRGRMDYQRHQEKLRLALLEGDAGAVGREVLVVDNGERITRIPFLFLRQHGFTFASEHNVFIGWDDNGSGGNRKAGTGLSDSTAGTRACPGVREFWKDSWEFYPSSFEGWALPGFHGNAAKGDPDHFQSGKKGGILDYRRTLLANLERNGRRGKAVIGELSHEDARYRAGTPAGNKDVLPVFLLLRDVSSSMEGDRLELSRELLSCTVRFLKSRYPETRIVYLVHDIDVRQVGPEEFFSVAKCGGTNVSQAYRLMLDILGSGFEGERYMCYCFHVSDGNLRLADAVTCRNLLTRILPLTRRFAYFQIGEAGACAGGNLYETFLPMAGPDFIVRTAGSREEVWNCLGDFFCGRHEN